MKNIINMNKLIQKDKMIIKLKISKIFNKINVKKRNKMFKFNQILNNCHINKMKLVMKKNN